MKPEPLNREFQLSEGPAPCRNQARRNEYKARSEGLILDLLAHNHQFLRHLRLTHNPTVSGIDAHTEERILLNVQFRREFPLFELHGADGRFICCFEFCSADEPLFMEILTKELGRRSIRLVGSDREIALFKNAVS